MLIVRPAIAADVHDLLELAEKAGEGMTSLPQDEGALLDRIQLSCDSFDRQDKHRDDFFFLVMEDSRHNKVVGTAGVHAMTGARQAFYAYRLMSLTHHSHSLNKQVRSQLLHLTNDYTDCSEVGALFLDPAYRGNGHWLARSRYLLMGLFAGRFAESVIAELRGWTDEQGNSPFWDAIGRHFFQMEFDEADTLCGIGSNQFITELMPKYPIYTSLLPEAAQAVIGKPADAGRRAKQLLELEGFSYDRVVDIFDAGPLMRAELSNIRSVRAIRQLSSALCADTTDDEDADDSQSLIIANPSWQQFRVICTEAQLISQHRQLIAQNGQQRLALSASALGHLGVQPGQPLAFIPEQLGA